MHFRRWIAAVAAGLGCAGPVHAEPPRDPFADLAAQIEALLGPRALAGSVVNEQDIELLLAHLRAALSAAARGEPAPPADDLARRAEAIRNALEARGTLAGLLLLDALEARARQLLRDAPAGPSLPPSRPYIPLNR
jgi:hypothetical protein